MSDLGTALRELADRQQPGGGQEPADLWARGRQRVRRRRALAAGLVAAVALTGAGAGFLLPDRDPVVPAGRPHAPGFPTGVHLPRADMHGTEQDGPLGQLAVLAAAPRGNGRAEPGLFGISAITGQYRFIDLPGRVSGTRVAMAPDGKHVAYWYTGAISGSFTATDDQTEPVVGVGIYDTTTGKVQRWTVPSAHGLWGTELIWPDDDNLLFLYSFRTTKKVDDQIGVVTRDGGAFRWGPGQAEPQEAHLPEGYVSFWPNRDGTFLQPGNDTTLTRIRQAGSGRLVSAGSRVTLPRRPTSTTEFDVQYTGASQSGDLLVAVPNQTAAYTNPLMSGRVGPGGTVSSLAFVDRIHDATVLGWHDAHTVVVAGFRVTGSRTGLYAVDLSNDQVRYLGQSTVIQESSNALPSGGQVATDLLGNLVPDHLPPRASRHWILVLGWIPVAALLLGWSYVRWRRARA